MCAPDERPIAESVVHYKDCSRYNWHDPEAQCDGAHCGPQPLRPADTVAFMHINFCHNSRCLICAPSEVQREIEAVWERYEAKVKARVAALLTDG